MHYLCFMQIMQNLKKNPPRMKKYLCMQECMFLAIPQETILSFVSWECKVTFENQ